MSKYLIYMATNTVNGMSYIGFTDDFDRRKNEHLRKSKNQLYDFHKALSEFGVDVFEWEILEEGIDRKNINHKEIEYIYLHGTYNNGYNMTVGGEGSAVMTDDGRRRISEANKGNEYCVGRKISYETRKKMSDANRNRYVGDKSVKSKRFLIITPDGERIEIKGLAKFCREHGLDQGTMTKVSQGKHKHHKGYKCKKIKE